MRALSEGLRQEVKPYNIRTTIISPGAVETELTEHINDPEIKKQSEEMYKIAISPDAIAKAAYAINQPEEFDINEILIRPNQQPS